VDSSRTANGTDPADLNPADGTRPALPELNPGIHLDLIEWNDGAGGDIICQITVVNEVSDA